MKLSDQTLMAIKNARTLLDMPLGQNDEGTLRRALQGLLHMFEHQFGDDDGTWLTPIENAAWNLIYNMAEVGAGPKNDAWWEQEYYYLRRLLIEQGVSVEPMMGEPK